MEPHGCDAGERRPVGRSDPCLPSSTAALSRFCALQIQPGHCLCEPAVASRGHRPLFICPQFTTERWDFLFILSSFNLHTGKPRAVGSRPTVTLKKTLFIPIQLYHYPIKTIIPFRFAVIGNFWQFRKGLKFLTNPLSVTLLR